MDKNYYCVIMAGGIGSRFWPLSKTECPKQFLDILGTGRTLLQQTFDRFHKIMPPDHVYVVSNLEYKEIIADQLPMIPEENILLEPLRRNTAPCIDYANFRIYQKNPNARVVVAPSDHLIIKEEEFLRSVEQGLDFVLEILRFICDACCRRHVHSLPSLSSNFVSGIMNIYTISQVVCCFGGVFVYVSISYGRRNLKEIKPISKQTNCP